MDQQTSLTYTVTMDANLARHVGRCAAMLYNILVWQSQSEVVQNYDNDGWFYLTAKRFEALTSYSVNKFTQASDKLVECGLIEKKKTFRHDAIGVSCTHFKVLTTNWTDVFEKPVSQKLGAAAHRNCETNIKEERKEERGGFTPAVSETHPQSSLGSAPKEVVEDFPVGAEEQKVSVRPNKKEADPAKRCWAVAKQVLEAWGYRAPKVSSVLAGKVKTWLDAGFSPEQIIEAGGMMKENGDEYWKSATPIQMLSENGLLWYQTNRKKILLDKIPHAEMYGKLYQIDPKTGGIVKEIKL